MLFHKEACKEVW